MLYELQYWERKSRRMKLYVLIMVGDRKGLHTRMVKFLKIENDFIIYCLQKIKDKGFIKNKRS
ncbi:hypothetical protein CN582_28175 [Bacillus wiedmannii]|nr:hypothetical protein CN646_12450 [Bacillus wiedmannii]PEJ49807.1 hypothetical protein CN672_10215 [Bacillus wiedmannii]PEL61140.1 hypothetical protein CN622_15795 [Bacillus wiedmannii]PEM11156.1 hypothetical protein CN610_11400 [Bacillus wiedmannii]PEP25897.1 hypothetical protein CN580_07625 [Bacillus wiedmannii]